MAKKWPLKWKKGQNPIRRGRSTENGYVAPTESPDPRAKIGVLVPLDLGVILAGKCLALSEWFSAHVPRLVRVRNVRTILAFRGFLGIFQKTYEMKDRGWRGRKIDLTTICDIFGHLMTTCLVLPLPTKLEEKIA